MHTQAQAEHCELVKEHEAVVDARRLGRGRPRVGTRAAFNLGYGSECEYTWTG